MAARIVALLIPLAITLPQLQTTRPPATLTPEHTTVMASTTAPQWSPETRCGADAALTRVAIDAPAHEAMATLDGRTPVAVLQAAPDAAVRKVPTARASTRLARPALLAKGSASVAAVPRPSSRPARTLALQARCEPRTHCAPVEVAKVTPVSRRSM